MHHILSVCIHLWSYNPLQDSNVTFGAGSKEPALFFVCMFLYRVIDGACSAYTKAWGGLRLYSGYTRGSLLFIVIF